MIFIIFFSLNNTKQRTTKTRLDKATRFPQPESKGEVEAHFLPLFFPTLLEGQTPPTPAKRWNKNLSGYFPANAPYKAAASGGSLGSWGRRAVGLD